MSDQYTIAQGARSLTHAERDQIAAICERLYAAAQASRNQDTFDRLYAAAAHGSDMLAAHDSGLPIESDRAAAWLKECDAVLSLVKEVA